MLTVLAFLIGVVAGLRSMAAPAAASWAAWLGHASVKGTWLSFMASPWAVGLLSLAACAELVTDQLPSTPSRKVPVQFSARILSGALSGAVFAAASGNAIAGAAAGALGAVVGTLGGSAARARLAAALGRDLPAALIEDVAALGSAALLVALLP